VETTIIKASKLDESQGKELKRKLLQHPGIPEVRIVGEIITVFYDKEKLSEEKIFKAIEKQTGCWSEIIEHGEPEKRENIEPDTQITMPPGVTIFSIILNIVLLIMIFRLTGNRTPNAAPQTNPNNPAANYQNAVSSPTIEQFDITKANHIKGNFDAPVTLVEFSDFECPFCEKIEPTFEKILKDYDSKVRLVYKHFPLSFHPNGQKAAEASECAGEQGKFWEYHDKLFEEQTNGFSIDNFKTWADGLNLKKDQFDKCLDSGKYAEKVKSDATEGNQKGVDGTPATFVNGKLVSGAVPYDEFKEIIESNIK